MNILPLKASFVDLNLVASADSFFDSVKEEYQDFQKSGFFNRLDKEGLYLYQIKRGEHKHLGLIAGVEIGDYIKGKILKHENTLAEKEQKIMNLILQRKAMIKPVLLTYPSFKPMKKWMYEYRDNHKPDITLKLESNSEKHQIWFIHEPELIAKFQRAFKEEIGLAYIADGHHRSSTMRYLYEHKKGDKMGFNFDTLFSVFFDFDELEIFEYNRIVDVLNDISPAKFMAELSRYFDIQYLKKARMPSAKFEIILYINKEWFSLRWKSDVLASYSNEPIVLDAHLLDELVFKNILGIIDTSTDSRISYVQGTKGLEGVYQKIHKDSNLAGFCLFPVALNEMTAIADQSKIMPPKSTWFEPRIRNGILVHEL